MFYTPPVATIFCRAGNSGISLYGGFASNITISLVCIGAAVVVGVCFVLAGPLARMLGVAGVNILTPFMGLILLSIAVGMFTTGLNSLMPGLAG